MPDAFNDSEEFINEFRSLVVKLQDGLEAVGDRVFEVLRKTAIETSKLNSYAESVAENMGLASLRSEQISLATRQTKLEKELELAADADRVGYLQEQLSFNQEIQQSLETQIEYLVGTAAAAAEAVGHKAQDLEYSNQIAQIETEIVRLEELKAGTVENTLQLTEQEIENRREILKTQLSSYKSMQSQAQFARQNEALRQKANEIFGINLESLKEKANDVGTLLGSWQGLVLLAAAAAKKLLGGMLEISDELRSSGISYAQTWSLTKDYIIDASDYLDRFSDDRLIAGPMAAAEAASLLASQYGDLDDLSQELVDQQLILTKAVGLSADASAMFLTNLEKLPGYTDQFSEDVVKTTRGFATINKIAPAKLFSIVAGHTQEMAQYGSRGAESFVRAAAAAAKMGIELSQIEGFQDRVLDIDTFIQDITKLRTLGMDFQDPFRLAELSQAGDIEGFVSELQSQLGGIGKTLDIQSLGRVQARALEQAFGMSLQDLQRLAAGEPMEALDPNTAAIQEQTQRTENLISSSRELLRGFDVATIAMVALTGAVVANTVAQGAGLTRRFLGMFGRGGIGGAGGRFTPGMSPGQVAPAAGGALSGLGRAGRIAPAVTKFAGRGVPLLAGVGEFAMEKARGGSTGRALAGGGGALAGAAAGAALGSVVPVLGTAVGAIVGSIVGSIGGAAGGKKVYDIAAEQLSNNRFEMDRSQVERSPETGFEQLKRKLGFGGERDEDRAAIPTEIQTIRDEIGMLDQIRVDTLIISGRVIGENLGEQITRERQLQSIEIPTPEDTMARPDMAGIRIPTPERENIRNRISEIPVSFGLEQIQREKPIAPEIQQGGRGFRDMEQLPVSLEVALPRDATNINQNVEIPPMTPTMARFESAAFLDSMEIVRLGDQISELVTQISSQKEEVKEREKQPMAIDTSQLENKMDDLIGMFRDGKISVNIDGRKAGKLIASSYQRGH